MHQNRMSVLKGLNDLIWNEKLWFPKTFAGQQYSWRDIENQPNSDLYYPELPDIHWGFLLGIGFVVLRFILLRWQFLYYTSVVIFGFAIQWDEVSRGVYWYYTIQLAFYWSLLFTLLSDVKQRHFMENVIHHSAALILISFSWTLNFVRFGALIFIIHDVSDPFLELAKLLTYLEKKRAADLTFIVFIILWIIGELIVLPCYVLYVCTFVHFDFSDDIALAYCVMILFLYVELVLVLKWTCHMYKWIRINITKMTKESN